MKYLLNFLILLTVSHAISYAGIEENNLYPTVHRSYPFSSEEIAEALLTAYPDIVKTVPKEENEYFPSLAINVRGKIFYDVKGRFLPKELVKQWKKYGIPIFYDYPNEIPDPYGRSPQEIKKLKKIGSKNYRMKIKSSYNGLFESLYGISSLEEAQQKLIKTTFLGKDVSVHEMAFKALKKVEAEIIQAQDCDIEIKKFLKDFDTIVSFEWRNIAVSQSRSFHAYGTAFDITNEKTERPKYWLSWLNKGILDWMREPAAIRWSPPISFVKIFEKYGFTWGGKWHFYDTEYYGYRPEILLLNGYDVEFVK